MKEKDTERKLTEAEQRRLDAFKVKSGELLSQGYEMEDLTVSPMKANTTGVLYGMLLALPFAVLFFLITDSSSMLRGEGFLFHYVMFFVVMFVLIVIHELIHGLTWSVSTENGFRSIEFGVIWKTLNPYCTCSEPLTKSQYMAGLLMPCLLLGVVPCLISYFTRNLWYLAMGAVMIMSAGGDILIGTLLLRHRSRSDDLFLDHPTDIGLVCFRKKDS